VAEFITSDLDQMATKNGQFKTLPARLSEEEIEQFFRIMQHANYPTMLFGRPAQIGWMFTKLMLRNAWRLICHPKMFRLMVG
jgi:hypothetical protein